MQNIFSNPVQDAMEVVSASSGVAEVLAAPPTPSFPDAALPIHLHAG